MMRIRKELGNDTRPAWEKPEESTLTSIDLRLNLEFASRRELDLISQLIEATKDRLTTSQEELNKDTLSVCRAIQSRLTLFEHDISIIKEFIPKLNTLIDDLKLLEGYLKNHEHDGLGKVLIE